MATKSSFWLRGKKGRLAGTTVYQSKGRTIQREIVDVSNPQTRAQMEQRIKWANLVNLYKVLKPVMKGAFESKASTQSDYNKFVSLNASAPIAAYLIKSEARQGFIAPGVYQLTSGSLGTFTMNLDPEGPSIISNINVGDLASIAATTTIGDLSTKILANNSSLANGMQISFVAVNCCREEELKTPSLIKFEFILDTTSTGLVTSFVPLAYIQVSEYDEKKYLGFKVPGVPGFLGAVIVSHTIANKTYVSSESLMMNSTASGCHSFRNEYVTLDKAIESYGVQDNAFLNSKEAKEV